MYSSHNVPTSVYIAQVERNKELNAAEEAAKGAIAKNYVLISEKPTSNESKEIIEDHPKKETRFFALGCQGNAKETQKKVAALMADLAVNPKHRPDFILFLGDNFYDNGVSCADDTAFSTHFDEIYAEFAKLNIPCFLILGNHDENLHNLGFGDKGVKIGMHQVAHSYVADTAKNISTEDKKKLYAQDYLNLNTLPLWNMPSRYYSLISGDTQIFCIDSNTYVSEYLEGNNTPNQATWLQREVQAAKDQGRKVILALHHPPMTPGKRSFDSDIDIYLSEADISKAKKTFACCSDFNLPSYNMLINETLQQQGLTFDVVLAAHDHAIYYYNDKNILSDFPLCQITSGGGGGGLQQRLSFKEQAYMGCYLQHHGFTEVSCKDNQLHFSIHTTATSTNEQEFHLEFTPDNCQPQRHYPTDMNEEEQNKIAKFCSMVAKAIEEYFSFINSNQENEGGKFLSLSPFHGNVSHRSDGVARANDLWAYISSAKADNYADTIETVYRMTKWNTYITNPTTNSLITKLDNRMEEEYGMNLESLYFKEVKPENRSSENCLIS